MTSLLPLHALFFVTAATSWKYHVPRIPKRHRFNHVRQVARIRTCATSSLRKSHPGSNMAAAFSTRVVASLMLFGLIAPSFRVLAACPCPWPSSVPLWAFIREPFTAVVEGKTGKVRVTPNCLLLHLVLACFCSTFVRPTGG